MKTILIAISALLITGFTFSQDFDRYENTPGVSSVIINKNMFKLMSKLDLDSEDKEIQEYVKLINNLEDIKILKTNDSKMSEELNGDAKSYIKNNNLEELMRANEDGKRVSFHFKPGKTDDEIKQLFMHINGIDNENETVVIIINGLIDLRQVSKLANDLKVPGANSMNKK
ncbi:DUF4252 domain-containing protein [Mesohalobacter halotolerans]|uniref:DUF4252 domain-containing protein n=1 Tax=Mesohalobacter halotolerans TaxID=1883405 RepID=A0A4V6ALE4_9FLAO|nr:DUF4252 domain-containing protein [Mesohalobacter halotolerans]MBS3738950.1 DUF4252 domain-containing protein [Psychroflexus sp.]TKS56375.1 DUF4252 domain-containing protein [Mesohalobacter halotolerans]